MALVQVDDDADEDVVAVLMDPMVDKLSLSLQHGTLEYTDCDDDDMGTLGVTMMVSEGTFRTDPTEHHPNTILSAAIHAFQMLNDDDLSVKRYKMDCRFVTFKADSLLTLCTSVSAHHDSQAPVITCNTATVPGQKTIANYGQVQCHMVSTPNITNSGSLIKDTLTNHSLPYLVALAESMGGNALASLRIIHATVMGGWCGVSVAGDVLEVVPVVSGSGKGGRTRGGSFSSPQETLMIGDTVL